MDFGSLRIVTAWRLTKGGASCQAIVMDAPEGFRLVVIEDQRIVAWERFTRAFDLRHSIRTALKTRSQAGWVRIAQHARLPVSAPSKARAERRAGLLAISEVP